MADNAELIEKLRNWVACQDPYDTAQAAADALEAADAKIAELTEIVESVRHIQALKTFVNAKVKKLQALNRRLR